WTRTRGGWTRTRRRSRGRGRGRRGGRTYDDLSPLLEITAQNLGGASVGDAEPQRDRLQPALLIENPHGPGSSTGIGTGRLTDREVVIPSLLVRRQQGAHLESRVVADA